MTPKWLPAYGRPSRTFEKLLILLFLSLFLYSLADWLGVLPFEQGFQPLRMVLLSGGALLQPIAALFLTRSRGAVYGLLSASLVLIAASFVVAS